MVACSSCPATPPRASTPWLPERSSSTAGTAREERVGRAPYALPCSSSSWRSTDTSRRVMWCRRLSSACVSPPSSASLPPVHSGSSLKHSTLVGPSAYTDTYTLRSNTVTAPPPGAPPLAL
jgi:hypothetical protein